jgi:hypothetical protein
VRGGGSSSAVIKMLQLHLASISAALVPILSSTPDTLADVVGGKGRARVVWETLRSGADPFTAPPEKLGQKARVLLSEHFGPPGYSVLSRSTSSCGTTKLLLQMPCGDEIETVIIPSWEKGFSTLCVSSQVGCRQACRFCLTGTMGLKRSLDASEILSQLHAAMHDLNRPGNQLPRLRNVVFMGAPLPRVPQTANKEEARERGREREREGEGGRERSMQAHARERARARAALPLFNASQRSARFSCVP